MKQRKDLETRERNKFQITFYAGLFLMAAVTAGCLFYFQIQMNNSRPLEEKFEEYQEHYVFITAGGQESFYRSIYQGASQAGEALGSYVEFAGRNLSVPYSREELMEIAISAGADGIILEADDSEEVIRLINKAVEGEEPIPVVTVGTDSTGSLRQSYVGIGYYSLGQRYGERILELSGEGLNKVMILMKQDLENSSQNIVYSGVKETLEEAALEDREFDIEVTAVNHTSSFGAEEAIRNIVINPAYRPDILICLDELNTACACQVVVEYNKVGEIDILGYYDSPEILDAVEKNVIQGTVAVDAKEMGKRCVEALAEYRRTGFVNEYMPVDITMITQKNIREYRQDER